MNFIKRYDGIKQSELLFFMFDSEFYDVVGMGKVRLGLELGFII
jgi:hypothetical protein